METGSQHWTKEPLRCISRSHLSNCRHSFLYLVDEVLPSYRLDDDEEQSRSREGGWLCH